MATTPTTKPVPSEAPQDLKFNIGKIDQFVTGGERFFVDRLGNKKNTIAGINNKFDAIVASLDTASFTFSNVSSGLTATANGQYFRVPQGVDSLISFRYYRNSNGAALEVADLAGAIVVSILNQHVQDIWADCGRGPVQQNIFDKARAVEGYYLNSLGELTADSAYFTSDHIPVLASEQYVFAKNTARISFYDMKNTLISSIASTSSGSSFTTPSETYTLRFSQTLSTGKAFQMLMKGMVVPERYIGFSWRDYASQDLQTATQVNAINRCLMPAMMNIFDKTRMNSGYALSTNGSLIANAAYFVTDYIPVVPGNSYICNKPSSVVVYYDANYRNICNATLVSNTAFMIPEGVVWMRFQQSPLINADALMVCPGNSLPKSYLAFGYPTTNEIQVQATSAARKAAEQSQLEGRNIFDKNRARIGYSISPTNGAVSTNANFFTTGLLPVMPGDYFVSTYGSNSVCFYDVNGVFLSGSTSFSGSGKTPIPVPENAWYVQFQGTPATRAESLMVTCGQTVPTGYIPFGGTGQILPWQNKNIIWLGDSITYNGLYQPYIIAGTGMAQLANYGVPGQGVRTMADSLNATTIANADFISIFGGTNDWGGNRPLGTIADARADYDDSKIKSFYYDCFYVLNKINNLKPSVRVMFSTPLMRGQTPGQNYVYPATNGLGLRLEDYAQAIKDVCVMFAVPVCDLLKLSGINTYNLTTFTSDNLHPNSLGSERHSREMIATFNAA